MTGGVVTSILPTGFNHHHFQSLSNANSWSISDTETRIGGKLSKISKPITADDLGRAYRTRLLYKSSQTEPGTRSEEAAKGFTGFVSSDSKDNNEREHGRLHNRKLSVYVAQ